MFINLSIIKFVESVIVHHTLTDLKLSSAHFFLYHCPYYRCKMSYSSRSSSRATDCKVYVGDLGNGAAKGELERAFSYYGPLRSVWVARNPPGFAFVEYEDARDAEDAVKGMDGK